MVWGFRTQDCKLMLVMKLCLSLILIPTISLIANSGYSQETKLSLKLKNATIREAIEKIEQKSEFIFIYYDGVVDLDKEIKSEINVKNVTVDKILDKVLATTDNTYKFYDRQIVIGKKELEQKELAVSPAPESQQPGKKVSGEVKDDAGAPIPGASILVKGTTVGTVTDLDGKFTIDVPTGFDTLLFSFMGYSTQAMAVGDRNVFNVNLQSETVDVGEVFVVAYGTQKKESVVGAISQVKGEELARSGQTTISNALAGQVPGVITVQQSGLPGNSDAKIFIRGISTFGSNTGPLVLVDGVERSLNDIDPSEVQNISVLKDASATAVYGVKGANGVILVTTKRGQLGRMEISVQAEQSLVRPSIKRDVENSYETLFARNKIYRNRQEWANVMSEDILEHYRIQDMPYVYPDKDPSELMLKPFALDSKYSVSARGGTENVKYFVSLGAISEGGIFKDAQTQYDPGYQYHRYNFRSNFDFDLTKSTKVSISSGGFVGTQNVPGATYQYIPRWIMYNSPFDSPYVFPEEFVREHLDDDWPYEGQRLAGSYITLGEMTPYNLYNNTGSTRSTKHRLGADFEIKQDLGMLLDGLSAQAMISYNSQAFYNAGKINFQSEYFLYNEFEDGTYKWTRYVGKIEDYETVIRPSFSAATSRKSDPKPRKNVVYSARLDYRKTFAEAHNVYVLGLFKRRQSQTGASYPHYEEDWVGRFTYDYRGKYLLEFNFGYTGSEQFSPDLRYGKFPAYAIGWNVAKEQFVKDNLPMLNNLKVRYSYGESGSDATGDSWLYISEYLNSRNGINGILGTSTTPSTIKEGKVPNYDARWERSIKNNLGLEFGFLENMFTLSVDLFNERRDGILMDRIAVPGWFGQELQKQNIGATKVHGYEIEAGYRNKINKINYWLRANFNFNENRIVARDDPKLRPDYLKQEGKPIGQPRHSYNIGYYQDIDEMLNYSLGIPNLQVIGADKVLDFNGDGVLNANDAIAVGNPTRPKYSFGFSAGFSYNRLDFSFLIQGNTGVSRNFGGLSNPINDHNKQAILFSGRAENVWTPDNRNAEYGAWGGWNGQQKYRIDASFARLKSVELGYKFSGDFVSRIGLNSARIYLQGINLLTYAPNVTVGDPEAEPQNTVENASYPLPKRVNLGVKINF